MYMKGSDNDFNREEMIGWLSKRSDGVGSWSEQELDLLFDHIKNGFCEVAGERGARARSEAKSGARNEATSKLLLAIALCSSMVLSITDIAQ